MMTATCRSVFAASVLVGFLGCTLPRGAPPDEPSRPNLVVIFGDDFAQWAVGAYGNPTVETPHIDALAGAGVLFENATSPSAVCSPARASFFSGLLPSQHGIHDFLRESREFDRDWLAGIPLLPERLQAVGYRTALVGKWHLTADSTVPYRGFDRWLSYDVWRWGWRNQYDHEGAVALSDQGRPLEVEGPQSEALTQQALEFIESIDTDQPFFLFLGPADTHEPFSGQPQRHVARYADADFQEVPRGETSPFPVANERFSAPDDPSVMLAQYYAGVSMAGIDGRRADRSGRRSAPSSWATRPHASRGDIGPGTYERAPRSRREVECDPAAEPV